MELFRVYKTVLVSNSKHSLDQSSALCLWEVLDNFLKTQTFVDSEEPKIISYIPHTFLLYSGYVKEIQDVFIGYVNKVAHYKGEHAAQAPYLRTQLAHNTFFIGGSCSGLWELNEVSDTARVIVKKMDRNLNSFQHDFTFDSPVLVTAIVQVNFKQPDRGRLIV